MENLLFPSLALVGDQAPRKDDGTDFGCVSIQSYGLIALEIKCCSWDLSTHALLCLFLGVGEEFLTNLCYFPKIAKKHTVLFLFGTLNNSNTHLDTCCCFSTPSFHNLSTWWGYLVCVYTGKAWLWWGILFLCWKETGFIFQSSKVPSRRDSNLMRGCGNFFENWHLDVCNRNWPEICFF